MHPGLEPRLVPSALCSLGPRRGSTAVPHTVLSPDSGLGDPREGSDLHEGFLSALPGGERVREALYRPLNCGLKIRAWGISTMAWTPPLLTLLTLCSVDWLWEGGGLIRLAPCYFLPLFENSLGTITRDSPVCLHCSGAGSWAQFAWNQEAEGHPPFPGNSKDAGACYVGW